MKLSYGYKPAGFGERDDDIIEAFGARTIVRFRCLDWVHDRKDSWTANGEPLSEEFHEFWKDAVDFFECMTERTETFEDVVYRHEGDDGFDAVIRFAGGYAYVSAFRRKGGEDG